MDFTPIDVRQQQFKKALFGLDRVEVTSFLTALADHYEQALRETQRLREEIAGLEATVKELRTHEGTIKTALVAAQELAGDIKANARQEAERIIRDAQSRSDVLLEKTEARLDEVRRDITSLTLKRRDVETTIESTIHALEHTLEYIRAQDVKELDELFPGVSDMGESTAPAFSIAGLERIAQATGEMLRQSTGGLSMERSGS
jgi:cell division initiation protein